MSFIKSDSLLSNIKNISIRIDMRPNDGSNIFKSIFSNMEQKQKSIKFESLFDMDSNMNSINDRGNSLIDKLTGTSNVEAKERHHFNWIVCKNGGMSEEEDDEQEEVNANVKEQIDRFGYNSDILLQQKHSSNLNANLNANAIADVNKANSSQLPNSPLLQQKKIKNETKNIPKNYGKAIICYIQKYRHKVQLITDHFQVDYFTLLEDLKRKKKCINTIADLRNLWSKYKYAKCMRVITYEFLRKHALSYIFDSRICTYGSHIKYRQRLCEAVGSPDEFKHIKDY